MMMIFRPLVTDIPLPERFTYPFCYVPHPLCLKAVALLQKELKGMTLTEGKMFGVLIVTRPDGQLGWLAAYSGLLEGRNDWPQFVPPVFDAQQPQGYFKTHEAAISSINQQLAALNSLPAYRSAKQHLADLQREADEAITAYQLHMAESKQKRDAIRKKGLEDETLIKESQFQKAELKRIKQHYAALIAAYQQPATIIANTERHMAQLKEQRRQDSENLQQWLFSQYKMRNAQGEKRDLMDIFAHWERPTLPPAGSGDCCAPKLLQYAYLHQMHPISMAEFWWGESPKTEVRRHGNYYPACRGKCLPILTFMMQGLQVDPNPHLTSVMPIIPIVYEDDWLLAIDKPAGMLSVPGKLPVADVVTTLKQQHPHLTFLQPVHRLDMDTSGLLLLAKTSEMYKLMQQQFLQRDVHKCYIALLDGSLDATSKIASDATTIPAVITLPLRPDPLDRPRQLVDTEHGKPAVTYYQIISQQVDGTLVELHPHTGRTHQLRVHCAHPAGLNCPIKGDPLYGTPAARLYLHAQSIRFLHPITHQEIRLSTPLPW